MIKECFKNRDFRVLWGAGGMTGIARAMEFLALSLYALQELGLPYLVTIIFAARMLPMSLLGIIIGTISERISPSPPENENSSKISLAFLKPPPKPPPKPPAPNA